MKPQRVIILNRENEKLVGYLYKNTSRTLMIMCHGVDPINGYPGIDDVFAFYYTTGTSIYCFDFSGYGESEGENVLSIHKRVSDLDAVIEYFSDKYERIILYGISLGAICATVAAKKSTHINRVVVVNGFFSLNPHKLYMKQSFGIALFLVRNPNLLGELVYFLKSSPARKVTVPTLIVYGDKDRDVKPVQSLSFYSKLSTEKRLLRVPGGDHILMDKEKWSYLHKILDWIKMDVVQ